MSHDELIHPAFDDERIPTNLQGESMSAPIPEDLRDLHEGWIYSQSLTAPTILRLIERIASLEAQVQKLQEEAATADEMYDAQYKKFEDCPHSFGGDTRYLCACSFDRKSDVCAVHAPQLKEALVQVRQLREVLDMMLSSAHPNERDHPAMFCAWKEAGAALAATEPKP